MASKLPIEKGSNFYNSVDKTEEQIETLDLKEVSPSKQYLENNSRKEVPTAFVVSENEKKKDDDLNQCLGETEVYQKHNLLEDKNNRESNCFENELSLSQNLVSESNQWFKEIKPSTNKEHFQCRILNENDGTFLTDFENKDSDSQQVTSSDGNQDITFEDIVIGKVDIPLLLLKEKYPTQNLTTEEKSKCLHFNELPDEIILRIFSFFTKRELCSSAAPVCLSWFHLAKDPLFWTSIIKTDFEAVESRLLIKMILSWCKQLTHLELDTRSDISEEEFETIFKSRPKITKLSLGMCRNVNDQVLKLLSKYEKQLESINLHGCDDLTDSSFAYFIELPIRSIIMPYCNRITDEGAIFVARNFRHLKEVNFDGIQWVTDDFVKELIAKHSGTLEKVFLDGENINDDSITLISKCPKIRSLGVSFCNNLTCRSIFNIQKCSNLSELKLRKGANFKGCSLNRYFEQMDKEQGRNFRTLNLAECTEISDNCLHIISNKCFNLVYLDLSWCWEVLDSGLSSVIDNCHNLKQLHLVGLHALTGAPLTQIPRQMPSLEHMDLSQCNKIEDDIPNFLVSIMPRLSVKNYYGELLIMAPRLYSSDDEDDSDFW